MISSLKLEIPNVQLALLDVGVFLSFARPSFAAEGAHLLPQAATQPLAPKRHQCRRVLDVPRAVALPERQIGVVALEDATQHLCAVPLPVLDHFVGHDVVALLVQEIHPPTLLLLVVRKDSLKHDVVSHLRPAVPPDSMHHTCKQP